MIGKLIVAGIAAVSLIGGVGVGTASASTSSYYPTSKGLAYSYSPTYGYTPNYYWPGNGYTPSYSYTPTSYYGQLATITGLPRTHYVHGYFRSNGTYVAPYWRSCSYCRS